MVRLRIKEVAQSKGFSMHRLSRATDINITTIQKLYRDPHAGVTIKTLEKIAHVLGCSVSDLIEEVPDP